MGCGQSKSKVAVYANDEERETMETLELFGFSVNDIAQLIRIFDSDSNIPYGDLLQRLGLPDTVGMKYMYKRTKKTMKETITFRNFCVCSWLYLTRSQEQLASMYFDAYDERNSGELESKSIFRLVYDMYGDKDLDFKADELLQEVDRDREETLTKYEFMNHVYKYKSILKPLYAMQRAVQEKVLGYAYWTAQTNVAPRIMLDPSIGVLFKALPTGEYYYRERVSRYPSLAKVNSYRKAKRKTSVDLEEQRPVPRVNYAPRRKSSLLENLGVGEGEVVQRRKSAEFKNAPQRGQ